MLLVFNRPDLTRQCFSQIRVARPSRLYIAADGPRPDVSSDFAKCMEVRRIVSSIDWSAQVYTRFSDGHLGCRRAVTEAMNWFFRYETEGIIVEDDCVVEPTFFRMCSELLEKYRHDERILSIGASNFIPHYPLKASYCFSRLVPVWGWATWRRAWTHYDSNMSAWPEYKNSGDLSYFGEMESVVKGLIEAEHLDGRSRTWGVLWRYHCLRSGGMSVIPRVNMVRNIGFAHPDATRHRDYHEVAEIPVKPLQFPLVHPALVQPNPEFDQQALRFYYCSPSDRKAQRSPSSSSRELAQQTIDMGPS